MKPIISSTGIIHGRGRSRFKWVSNLTDNEREAVRRGELVLVRDENNHHSTTKYKQVLYRCRKYTHRNFCTEDEL